MVNKKNKRDDFSQETRNHLSKQVACICSNPLCKKQTNGPDTTLSKSISIGIAAHICAASPEGPRYDAKMTTDERKDIKNGIWLCSNCAALIDRKPELYTIELLQQWKSCALSNASQQIGKYTLSEIKQDIDNQDKKIMQYDFYDINALLSQAVKSIDELVSRQGDSDITGMPTGFSDLDKMTSGLQEGDLVIVAGRPSMGKTTFALNVAEHIAFEQDAPVAVFSMEMSSIQLIMRTLGSVCTINQQNLRTGKLDHEEWQNLLITSKRLKDKAFYSYHEVFSIETLRNCAVYLASLHGNLGCIVIDYIQLMSANGGSKGENRATEISEISRSLKTLAKELKCPVIALSQLNRGLEQRPNKRPIMSDLPESGAIEQDADIILFIYRDEVYHPDSQDKGMAEIIISKQRNGPIGTVRLAFQGKFTRFVNYVDRLYQDED